MVSTTPSLRHGHEERVQLLGAGRDQPPALLCPQVLPRDGQLHRPDRAGHLGEDQGGGAHRWREVWQLQAGSDQVVIIIIIIII